MEQISTRQKILDAAMETFLVSGYGGASIAQIRQISGATTGSIYHFFGSKSGIASALWAEALSGETALSVPAAGKSAQKSIRNMVRSLMIWARDNPNGFRIVDELQGYASRDADFAGIRDELDATTMEFAKAYASWERAGDVVDLPASVAYALILGPTMTYLRARHSVNDLAIEALSAAAWRSVAKDPSATPAPQMVELVVASSQPSGEDKGESKKKKRKKRSKKPE